MDRYRQAITLWQSYEITTVADLDKCLDSFSVLFAFHSGRIENEEITYRDTWEIFKNGRVSNYTGSPYALFEQHNQKLCYEFLKEKIIKKEPLTIKLIKEIHKVLTSGTFDERRYIENGERPGDFKEHDYITGIHEVGSAPENVEADLRSLLEEVNAYEGKEVLKAAAYLHAKFEFIHPFADGNGRVGRTLMNYYLMIFNHPPIIVYDKDKRLYYESLQKYDQTQALDSLYEFFKYETQKTWEKALNLAEGIQQEHKGLTDLI